MKIIKISYYVSTGLIALMMTYSAISYLTQPAMAQTFQHLGFPAYFRIELAIAKLLGVILLVAPISRRWKELAYAGFALTFVSAFIAHTCSGDPILFPVIPLVFLAILAGSYISYSKLQLMRKA